MSTVATLNRTFSQSDFDCFAELSGDCNPIHIDAEFSANSRFGRTVAHGLLLLSVVRELTGKLAPGMRMVEQQAMFPAPTYADQELRFVCEQNDAQTGVCILSFEVVRVSDGIVTCKGSCQMEPA